MSQQLKVRPNWLPTCPQDPWRTPPDTILLQFWKHFDAKNVKNFDTRCPQKATQQFVALGCCPKFYWPLGRHFGAPQAHFLDTSMFGLFSNFVTIPGTVAVRRARAFRYIYREREREKERCVCVCVCVYVCMYACMSCHVMSCHVTPCHAM